MRLHWQGCVFNTTELHLRSLGRLYTDEFVDGVNKFLAINPAYADNMTNWNTFFGYWGIVAITDMALGTKARFMSPTV
jgi:hypothetical protein